MVGVDARDGVRAWLGEAEDLAVESRAGVPGGGLLAGVVEDMLWWCSSHARASESALRLRSELLAVVANDAE